MNLFRIISYFIEEASPTKYPISDIEEEMASSSIEMKLACMDNCNDNTSDTGNKPYCMIIQELKIGDSGRFVLLDEEIRSCQPVGAENKTGGETAERFSYGDIVEVIDDFHLTLGIIVHIPHQFYNGFEESIIDKPYLHHQFSVLLYKPDGTIQLKEVSPTHLLRPSVLEANSQIAALRTVSEDICVQE